MAIPSGGPPTFLAADATNVLNFGTASFPPPVQTAGTFPAFGSPVTKITSSYDGLWNGVGSGALFQFFYNLGSTASGSIAGAGATIETPRGGD